MKWSNQNNIDLLRARDMFEHTYAWIAKKFNSTPEAVRKQLSRLHLKGCYARAYRRYEKHNIVR